MVVGFLGYEIITRSLQILMHEDMTSEDAVELELWNYKCLSLAFYRSAHSRIAT